MKTVLLAVCLVVLAGCAVPPEYQGKRRVCVDWSSICYFTDGKDADKGPPAY
jgi:hypothetical protein